MACLHNAGKTVSSINDAGKTGQLCVKKKKEEERKKLGHSLTSYSKISLKCIKGLNVTPETVKLLEENIGKTIL